MLEFGERLDLVLWETCHIYATCQAYRAEADFQQKEQRVSCFARLMFDSFSRGLPH